MCAVALLSDSLIKATFDLLVVQNLSPCGQRQNLFGARLRLEPPCERGRK
jgi:hypothetical protein